ncbi:MAG: tetraacyldisaccharide 4'-kinase [Rhodospirillales bacterium]
MNAIFIYRLFQILCFPFIVVYFLARGLKDRRYFQRFGERLGLLPGSLRQTEPGGIWLHAVSVGEVLSAVGLLKRLRTEVPGAPLFVSVTTLAGRAAAEDKLRGVADGIFYAPIDYCSVVRRVLRRLRPRMLVVMETEIWPNLYREAKRAGCGLVIVNGRISDRAMPRYRAFRWLFRRVLAWPDAILAQTEISAQRFRELGAPDGRVKTAGNLKYDFEPRDVRIPPAIRSLLDRVAPGRIWIAASTMPPAREGDPDEDEAVADAFQTLAAAHPELLLVLVPRKPERFDTAAAMLERRGIPFVRRSALPSQEGLPLPGVLLLDSIGELSSLFGLADVVFMGGTLAHRGGHNILEPAFFQRAVITGPHMENFPEIAEKFKSGGGVYTIAVAEELAGAVAKLLEDEELRSGLGRRAAELAEAERGATARAAEEIARLYWRAVSVFRPPAPVAAVLWPLSQLWLAGGWLKRTLGRRERLRTPVVSVGNLTTGGTGKSPFVLWLAGKLKARGLQPAILTRGYRRRTAEKHTIVGPGEYADVSRTGDEAQDYLRAAIGPVGIAADRAGAGRMIEKRFHPAVFLLDDGFQHYRLERALDIVLIDALNPFGGGAAVPLGSLREGLGALRRAGIVVITRWEVGRKTDGIEAVIRRYNPDVPVFRARVAAETWRPEPPSGPAAAFCGLGNPDSFWQTLRGLGIQPVLKRAFGDHHRYSGRELGRLAGEARAAGAEVLLTTAKDYMNLPGDWKEAIGGLPLAWLDIRVEVEGEEEFLSAVTAAIFPGL